MKWNVSNSYSLPGITGRVDVHELIIQDVADVFVVEKSDLYVHCRYRKVKYCRWVIWKILKSRGTGIAEMGRMFNHDHSTVLYALNRLDQDINKLSWLRIVWDKVKHNYVAPVTNDSDYVLNGMQIKDLKVVIIEGRKCIVS